MKKNKIIIAGLAVACLSSCGGTVNPDDKKDTITDPWRTTTGQLEKNGDNVVFEDVDIDLTTIVAGNDLAAFNSIVDTFNVEYNGKIHVNVNSIAQDVFDTTVSSQIAQKTGAPDLIMCHQRFLKRYADNKLIQPMDEAMEESGIEISMNDYAENLGKYSDLGYSGYTFQVPADAQSEIVFYNKDILVKYGGESVLPKNHSELISLLKRVKEGEGSGFVPLSWSTQFSFFKSNGFPTALSQNGVEFYDTEKFTVDWTSEENLNAFKNGFQSLRDIFNASPSICQYNLSESQSVNLFTSGKSLFFVYVPWEIETTINKFANDQNLSYSAAKEKIGATSLANWFAMDENSENANKIFGDSHSFAISTTVKDINVKAAIAEFTKWFTTNAEVGVEWAEAGHISASTTIGTSKTYTDSEAVKNYIQPFYNDINDFVCSGNTPYYEITFNYLQGLASSVLTDTSGSNDKSILESAQKTINDTIEFL